MTVPAEDNAGTPRDVGEKPDRRLQSPFPKYRECQESNLTGPREQINTVFSLLIKQKGATGCLWAGEPQGLTGILGRSPRLALTGGGDP